MAKKRKLGKRLRKGVKRVAGSQMVQDVVEKLITAALLAAAVKLRDSATGTNTAKAVKKKAGGVGEAIEAAVTGEGGGKRKAKAKKRKS